MYNKKKVRQRILTHHKVTRKHLFLHKLFDTKGRKIYYAPPCFCASKFKLYTENMMVGK